MGNVESRWPRKCGRRRVGQWKLASRTAKSRNLWTRFHYETREYVEIVSRNAEIYRKIYGVQNESASQTARKASARISVKPAVH